MFRKLILSVEAFFSFSVDIGNMSGLGADNYFCGIIKNELNNIITESKKDPLLSLSHSL